jgi:uncharacterized protein
MARLVPDEAAPGPIVQGFSGAGFAVDGRIYPAVLLIPTGVLAWSPPAGPAELTLDHFALLLALERPPEFLLLGTGPVLTFPPRPLVRALEAKGIGVEAMDSRAAARTWGLLRGEERWIAAALMPLQR